MEARLPRHVGLKATILLFVATGVTGVIAADRLDEVFGGVSAASGLLIDSVKITGQMETSEVSVLDKLQLPPDASLPFLDVASARDRIETLPWVAKATLRKVYPATLNITIEERKPFVLWQHDQKLSVIDDHGRVIGEAGDQSYGDLVRVIGQGAETRASEALALADSAPAIRARLKAAVLVGERRWDFILDNGVTLMLPQDNPQGALARIENFDKSDELLSRDIVRVDLRLGDRMFVRLSPAAMERRAAELKERDKLAKRKGAST
ncbi:FtsQ-type POTRA domain-containing protein [Kaistia dalseonensis]|uniref:Cell division protein FtsQ n=1 Tax=Kaistia dalseonensis TaxID=410840 RepID=A0ABU0HBT4_9HYPH|nr:cell division protein FtsQ/DivIB [Kaistia dalseonensis]MCX5497134.1 FtsQ-type POTRA domain-containing protein [Kaistia dalseonensis]MDQ0439761.1 cell division protein FtsQ [Kaistia dalseonensis]